MRTYIYFFLGLFLLSTSHQMIAQSARKSAKKGYTQSKNFVQESNSNINLSYNNTVPTKNALSSNIQRCGTDAHVANRNQSIQEKALIEALRKSAINKIANFIPCDGSNSIVIPVAVHYSADFDCTDTQCLIDAAVNNIATTNEDFAALNADITYYNSLNTACPAGYPLDVVSDGTCIQFCLATQNHPAAEGIADGQPAITVGQYNWTGGADAPNWAGYVNLFIAANTGGLGIAAAPGMANGDGVQMDAITWGGRGLASCSSGAGLNTNGTFNLGRTLTHELGHYFDLFHTFQDGCADGDTGTFSGQVGVINDTPATANSFSGCPTVTSCADAPASGCASQYAQITNYMDYTDDACMVMFSQDQAAVMNGWANSLSWVSDATVCTPPTSLTSLAGCSLQVAFNPADGSEIVVCTDEGSTIQFTDLSTNGPISWGWTFTVTGGDIVLSATNSTMQNPMPMVTAGTSGTLQVDLVVMDAGGATQTATQNYTITVLSGVDCPNECDYTLELIDVYGDGWNGATLNITADGVPIAGSPFGANFSTGSSEISTIALTDGATISFNQTNGEFPSEEGFILTDPFGNIVFDAAGGAVGSGEVFSFAAYCSLPTCDDGVQNGSEEGIDCGGSCPNACICNGSTITITIVLDDYPGETNWGITDANGNTVASGAYGNQPPGSTVTEEVCLADGCYDFTINDSYSDGICCDAGNGSYNVTDSDGNNLASGGEFGATETTNFCIDGGGPQFCDPIIDLGTAVLSTGTIHAQNEVISIGTIPASTNVSLKAGQIIRLENGFNVDANADAEMLIEDCAVPTDAPD